MCKKTGKLNYEIEFADDYSASLAGVPRRRIVSGAVTKIPAPGVIDPSGVQAGLGGTGHMAPHPTLGHYIATHRHQAQAKH